MANEGEPLQGGHNIDFGSTPPPAPPGAPGTQQPGTQPTAAPAAQEPAQPYPGQPGAPAAQEPAQPYAGQPAGQPYPGQPAGPPATKKSQGLLWGLVGGGIGLLALIAVLVLVVPAMLRPSGPGGAGGTDGPAASATAGDAVKAYLTAISKGDAKTALTYLDQPDNKDLLTDEVLEGSNKLAPMTGITVKESKDKYGSADVDASFTLGGKKVSENYAVFETKGKWKIIGGTTSLILSQLKGLPVTVNGVAAPEAESLQVFPGTYQVGMDSPYFSVEGEGIVTLVTSRDSSDIFDVKVALNDDGVSTYRSLVRSSLEACVAMTTFSTPCGMDVSGIDLRGPAPVDGTVSRTLTAEGNATLNALQAKPSLGTPTVVTASGAIRVDTSLQGDDGNTYTVLFGARMKTPKVDFAAAQPSVVWE